MADSILRLKVESQEYDSKLKQAAQGLTRYADECRKVGGTLEVVEKETLDYVRALGQMDTTSRTATGKLAEMKKTFVELSAQYKQMTDAEKASPFGKALAASLDELKGRIGESKVQLDDINKSISGGGGLTGALDAVAGKFGLSIDQVTKFGGVVGVATTAVQVAKDAFFQSESGIDEWGRTVEGAKGAYSVFLDTLNNGNWSNFFQNLSAAIKGGRDLYDVFDRLGSIKSNNAAAIAITQKEIAELRLAKQQGENVDAKLKAATERLAALQKQSVTAGMTAGSQSAFQTIRNGVNSIGGAGVNDATIKYAVDRIMKGGQGEFDKYRRNYDILQQKGMVTRTQTINDSQGGTYERQYKVFDINALTKEQQKQYAIAKAITEGETRIQQGIAAYAQAVSEGTSAAREEFKGNRYALQGTGGGGGGRSGGGSGRGGKGDKTNIVEEVFPEGSMKDLQRDMQELKKAQDLVTSPDEWQKYQQQIDAVTEKMNTLKGVAQKAPEMAEGVSGLNQKAISTYQSMLQESMKGMEYGSTDLTNTLANSIDVTTLSNLLKTTLDQGLDITKMRFENGSPIIEELWNTILSGDNIPDKAWEELGATISEELKKRGGKGIKINTATGSVGDEEKQEQVDTLQQMQKLNSGLSSINSGLQQIGIKLPDGMQKMLTVMQGVTSVIQGVQTVISVFSTSSQSANTAAVMANTGTMTALIAALTANTAALSVNTTANFIPFATGGIVHAASGVMVPGNSFSGDNIPALLNSGEVVLTRAQAGVIADALGEGNGRQGGGVPMLPYVSGDKIILGANNFLKGAGKGELVTTSFLRQKGLI